MSCVETQLNGCARTHASKQHSRHLRCPRCQPLRPACGAPTLRGDLDLEATPDRGRREASQLVLAARVCGR